jgi:hypothetical protein
VARADGDLDVRQGGGGALVAKNARIGEGFVAVLAAWNATLAPGARVLLRVTPAVSLAAAAGFIAGLPVRAPQGTPFLNSLASE